MKFTHANHFGMRLKYLISEILEITQAGFAEKVGITASYLSSILNDKREPSAELMAGLHIY
jgi:transcriptional regulator with XRE-family HTH domain